MSDKEQLNDVKSASAELTKKSDNSRRSFLRKASIGAPVVMASSATPAWATAKCMSAMMSGNLSNHEHTCELTSQNAKDCHYWKHKYVGYYKKHHGKTKQEECKILGISTQEFDNYKNHYYFWDHYNNKPLIISIKRGHSMGSFRMKQLLDDHELFNQEISAARLNAATCSIDPGCIMYPYTVQDVDQIYVDTLMMNSFEKREEVAHMLQGIRRG